MCELTRLKWVCALQPVLIAQAVLGPFYLRTVGIDMPQVFTLQAFGMGVMWVSSLAMGHLVERIGYRKTLIIGNALYAFALVMYAGATSYATIVVAHAALTLTTVFVVSAPNAWLSQLTGQDYGRHASIAMQWMAIATGLAQFGGGIIAQAAGNRAAITASMLVPIVCLVLARGVREIRPNAQARFVTVFRQIHRGKQSPIRLVLLYAAMYAVAVAPTGTFSALLDQAGFAVWLIGAMLVVDLLGKLVPPTLYGRVAWLRELSLRDVAAVYCVLVAIGYVGLLSRSMIGVPVGIFMISAAAVWSMLYMRPRLLLHPVVGGNGAIIQSVVTFYSLPLGAILVAIIGHLV